MTAPIIDRDAIIEKAAKEAWDGGNPPILLAWDELPKRHRTHSLEREYATLMLPSIADDLLAPIEALHYECACLVKVCHTCQVRYPCPTAQAAAAIREAVRA